jgi:formiminotetrahydrofolate cyclodeaminase
VAKPISACTLEQFRQAAAGRQPTPAGVAVAAVSAGFALGLLAKALAVSARRKALCAEVARLEPLAAAAQAASKQMLQLADDDIAAFEAYLSAARLPRSSEHEREQRRQAVDSAVRQAIELPLAAAREAAAGLQLCSEASTLTRLALIADLGTAATLLSSALRAFLLCAQSNIRQLAADAASYRERLASETDRHERAFRQAETVLERIAASLV